MSKDGNLNKQILLSAGCRELIELNALESEKERPDSGEALRGQAKEIKIKPYWLALGERWGRSKKKKLGLERADEREGRQQGT